MTALPHPLPTLTTSATATSLLTPGAADHTTERPTLLGWFAPIRHPTNGGVAMRVPFVIHRSLLPPPRHRLPSRGRSGLDRKEAGMATEEQLDLAISACRGARLIAPKEGRIFLKGVLSGVCPTCGERFTLGCRAALPTHPANDTT
jgi:hypothetical protein